MKTTTAWCAIAIACACACGGSKPEPAVGSNGSGGGAAACEPIRAKVEGLYRAEAERKEPARVAEAVADNTHMVLNDCAKDPAKVRACVERVATVAELEQTCLRPLDDEGSEGEELKR